MVCFLLFQVLVVLSKWKSKISIILKNKIDGLAIVKEERIFFAKRDNFKP